MTVIIKKNATKEEVEKILKKMKNPGKKGLRKFFGLNFIDTGGLDPVSYQKMLRNERD
ncbi:hypothetical protein [Flavobacterium sp.]|jgi:hypothetical protein|uniref:hypothetical protein n=1 Tax=Flavobacterium sp. TaxID=239 RepID=UPI0037BF88C1